MIIMADIFTNLIPFLFVLAVVYGALDYSNVLRKHSVKAIVSLAIAFFALTSQFVLDFINSILPYAVILFIIVFFLAFLTKLVKGKGDGGKSEPRDWTLIAIIILLILIAIAAYGQDMLNAFLPSMPAENFLYGVGIVLILLIFYAAYKNWGSE